MGEKYPDSIEGLRQHGAESLAARKAKETEEKKTKRKRTGKIVTAAGMAAATLATAFAVKHSDAIENKFTDLNDRKTPEQMGPVIPGEIPLEEQRQEYVEAQEKRDIQDKAEDTLLETKRAERKKD